MRIELENDRLGNLQRVGGLTLGGWVCVNRVLHFRPCGVFQVE